MNIKLDFPIKQIHGNIFQEMNGKKSGNEEFNRIPLQS